MDGGKILVTVAEMVLAELAGGITQGLQHFGDGWDLRFCRPTLAPGMPTFVRPVRMGFWPQIKQARPAVQLCWE